MNKQDTMSKPGEFYRGNKVCYQHLGEEVSGMVIGFPSEFASKGGNSNLVYIERIIPDTDGCCNVKIDIICKFDLSNSPAS